MHLIGFVWRVCDCMMVWDLCEICMDGWMRISYFSLIFIAGLCWRLLSQITVHDHIASVLRHPPTSSGICGVHRCSSVSQNRLLLDSVHFPRTLFLFTRTFCIKFVREITIDGWVHTSHPAQGAQRREWGPTAAQLTNVVTEDKFHWALQDGMSVSIALLNPVSVCIEAEEVLSPHKHKHHQLNVDMWLDRCIGCDRSSQQRWIQSWRPHVSSGICNNPSE